MFQDITHRANTLNNLRVSYMFNNYMLTHYFSSLAYYFFSKVLHIRLCGSFWHNQPKNQVN